MSDNLHSYFTCTLGEAQLLNASLPDAPYDTVNDLIDYLATKYGDTAAVACSIPGVGENWTVEALSFFEVQELSTTLASHLISFLDGQKPSQTVAFYASSSLSYLIHVLAFLRAGCKVALISTACNSDAVRHLLKAYNATAISYDSKHARIIKEVLEGGNGADLSSVTKIPIQYESLHQIKQLSSKNSEQFQCVRVGSNDDVVLYGHSSGTSTGLPKPIPVTHQNEIGALPRFHQLPDYQRPRSTLSTTPIYTGGLADLWRSWSAATTIWLWPENQTPITSDNIKRYIAAAHHWIQGHSRETSIIGYVSCVPYVTQMMTDDSELLNWLREIDMVGVGGATMPTALGDMLVEKGINLVSRFGSRECGFLLSSDREYSRDKDWQYLRHDERVGAIKFQKWNDTDFELIVSEEWPSLSPAIHEKLPFNSHDVFTPHGSIKNAWKYNGRSDVQITLLTGKKFDPAGIESALTASKMIKDAVVIGNNRLLPAAIIFGSEQAELLKDSVMRDNIWTAVSNVNDSCPSHSRIQRNMIAILPSTRASEIQKSSKGTIMRGKFDDHFNDIVQSLYDETEEPDPGPLLDSLTSEEMEKELIDLVNEQPGTQLAGVSTSFYESGIDSIMAMQIRNRLRARLSQTLRDRVPLNIVYNTGSVKALSDFLGSLSHSIATDQSHDSQFDDRETAVQQAREFLDAKSEDNRDLLETIAEICTFDKPKKTTGAVVLLTGATGFLGAHILVELVQNPAVYEIVCLVRENSRSSAAISAKDRVTAALTSYDLSVSGCSPYRIRYLYSALHEADLHLDIPELQRTIPKVTHIVHAAWAVNFTLPLKAYYAQLQGMVNLFNVAKIIASNGLPIKFTFISSTAAVTSGSQPIAEKLSYNLKDASSNGYGESKWLAESLLAEFTAKNKGIVVDVLRVGQLTASNKTGAWNKQEAWPLMLDAGFKVLNSSSRTAMLPDLSNAPDKELNWLPVDLAARSVMELVFIDTHDRSADNQVLKIYHVLSNITQVPTWEDAKNWLSGTLALKVQDQEQAFEVDFVDPQAWLNLLETAARQGTKHNAISLIPLWRTGWNQSHRSNDTIRFSTEESVKISKTMRLVINRDEGVTQETFLKSLEWLLFRR